MHAGNKNIRLEGDIMRVHNYSKSYFSQRQDWHWPYCAVSAKLEPQSQADWRGGNSCVPT